MKVSPRLAFLNVVVFVTVSLFVFMGRIQMITERFDARNGNLKGGPLRESIFRFIWPNARVKRVNDRSKMRPLLWETALNKTRSGVGRTKRFPDVIIVGAEHCGAEGLARLLMLHPMIKVARSIDTRFFTTHFAKGAAFYMSQMPWASPGDIVMESSPAYFSWPPNVTPNRIKDMMPKVKILVVLCNPVDRAHIDYTRELKLGRLPKNSKYEMTLGTYLPKFAPARWSKYSQWEGTAQTYIFDLFRQEYASHIITTGMYYHHILRWRALFDTEHLKVISREDMLQNTGRELEEIQDFLGLPQLLLKEDFVYNNISQSYCFRPTWSPGNSKPDTKCPLRYEAQKHSEQSHTCAQALKKFYAPFNKKLYRNLGRDFNW